MFGDIFEELLVCFGFLNAFQKLYKLLMLPEFAVDRKLLEVLSLYELLIP